MNAAQYLDALAQELAAAGWSTSLEETGLLLAFSPDPARAGMSVRVKAGVGGVPWFISSTGDPLRPCHDLTGAAEEVGALPVPHNADQARRRRLAARLRGRFRGSRGSGRADHR